LFVTLANRLAYYRHAQIGGQSGVDARHWTGFTLVAATTMLALPLWRVWAPAMPDYPAHLASFALISQGTGNAIYHLHWSFVPNLASEVLVPWLARLTGVVAATKIFLTAAIVLWVMGPGMIHRALYGRTGISPLLGAMFAYNANFIWGFFNYYFAAGLAFALFAGWIATDGRRTAWHLAGFTLAVTILYFCHLFAAASLVLMIAGYEIAQNWRLEHHDVTALARRAGLAALTYVPAALAFLFLKPRGGDEGGVEFNLLDTMIDRFESLISHAFDRPAYTLPAVLFIGLIAALVTKRARLHPAMPVTLVLMGVAALLAPEWALGGWAVHLRLPAVFAALLFASAEIRLPPRLRVGIAIVALAVIGSFSVGLASDWMVYDQQYREFTGALPRLPRGVRLLTVLDGNALGQRADQPYWHMAEFAVPERDAFTPLLFTTRGQHVVQLNPPYDKIAAASAQEGSPPDVDELEALARNDLSDPEMAETFPYLVHFQCHFDVAVVVHLDGKQTKVPPMLKLRERHDAFTLYDILPDQACR
jgi:hypothetical protein